jgi:hypothetical protein
MLLWITQITIISMILIFLVHYLINFFKSTLTVPKIKDLVNKPLQKYENIYNIIGTNNKYENNEKYDTINNTKNKDYSIIDLLPTTDESSMKDELKNFFKKQLQVNNDNNNIFSHETLNTNSYSNY